MKMRDRDPARPDPLLERLRALPSTRLDDVTSARTLARAEALLPDAGRLARAKRRSASSWLSRCLLPAALVAWGMLYVWGAVEALTRLFPGSASTTAAVAVVSSPTAP